MRAAVLLIALTACVGDNYSPPIGGPARTFVISRERPPSNNTDARNFALDVDGDGRLDNQLGSVVGALAGQLTDAFVPQVTIDQQVDRGELIQLLSVQTPGPDDDGSIAGVTLQVGANPDPVPCDGESCRRHLGGDAAFDLASSQAALPRDVDDDRAMFGTARIEIVIGFFGTPVAVELHGARVLLDDPSSDHLSGVIAGAIPSEQIVERLVPQWPAFVNTRVRRDCDELAAPPSCGCRDYTMGRSIINGFDKTHDCVITTEELLDNTLVTSLIAPDIDKQFLSLGFAFEAVPATLR